MSTLNKNEKRLKIFSFLLMFLMLVGCFSPFMNLVQIVSASQDNPDPPTNFTANATDIYWSSGFLWHMNITFTWNKSIDADKTRIPWSMSGYPTFPDWVPVMYNGTSNTYSFNNLQLCANGMMYISAWSWNTTSGNYSTAYVTTNVTTPPLPFNMTNVSLDNGYDYINASWPAISSDVLADSYDVVFYNGTYVNQTGITDLYSNLTCNKTSSGFIKVRGYNWSAEDNGYDPYTSYSQVNWSINLSLPDVPTPTVGNGYNYTYVNWFAGTNLTASDEFNIVYYNNVTGNYSNQTTALIYHNFTENFSQSGYLKVRSHNLTFDLYSNYSSDMNWSTLANPALSPYNFTATKINYSMINLSWSITPGVDKYYVEYCNDTNPGIWNVNEHNLIYNGTGLSYSHTGRNPNRVCWYKIWGYNTTYGVYSQDGILTSAQTDAYNGTITIGDDPNYIQDIFYTNTGYRTDWVHHIYPSNWASLMHNWAIANNIFGGSNNNDYAIYTSPVTFHNKVPYSWWNYWHNGGALGSPDTTHFNDGGDTGIYCWHLMDSSTSNEIELNYTKPIYGAITGVGIYFSEERKSTTSYSGHTFPFVPRNYPIDGGTDDIFASSLYSKMHLQINNQQVECNPQDGWGSAPWQNNNQFLYWDLSANDCEIRLTDEPILLEAYFEPMQLVNSYYVLETTPSDIDADNYTGFSFATGSNALLNYNDIYYSTQKEDTHRQFNYFFIYNPNLGGPGPVPPSPDNTTYTTIDQIIVTPKTMGQYEQTNIIYLVNDTLFTSYLNVYNASGGNVCNKSITTGSGNIFFTPLTSGLFTVNITRQGNVTQTNTFSVYAQSPHGYLWCDNNPVLKSNMFNIHVYYDIPDYNAVVRLYDEDMVQMHQWTIPNNRTNNLYDFSYTMTKTGKFYLDLIQQRPNDEQMITQYILWVKDREYVPQITVNKVTPHIGDEVTISIVQNIVGTAGLELKYWAESQNKYVKVDNVGDYYVKSFIWVPDKYTGPWTLSLIMTVIDVAAFPMDSIQVTVSDKLIVNNTVAPTEPIVNIPNLLHVGNVIGISDPMFKLIIGSLIVLFFMLSPLILAWKFKLKYADRILTNPMIYAGTAILGSLISFGLGLFELWVFLLIMIVALTFFIRAWRGHQQAAGE